jgi:hypothetical protein
MFRIGVIIFVFCIKPYDIAVPYDVVEQAPHLQLLPEGSPKHLGEYPVLYHNALGRWCPSSLCRCLRRSCMALVPNHLFFGLLFRRTQKLGARSHWIPVVLSCIVLHLSLDSGWPFVMVVNI